MMSRTYLYLKLYQKGETCLGENRLAQLRAAKCQIFIAFQRISKQPNLI